MEFESIAPFIIAPGLDGPVGFVDYEALLADARESADGGVVRRNLQRLGEVQDVDALTVDAQKAFYLNTSQLPSPQKHVTGHVTSVPTLAGRTSYQVAGKKVCMYNLEHKVIRAQFPDPRVHMYLNCASLSCPRLCSVWLTEHNVHDVLELVTRSFINEQGGVQVDKGRLHVSQVFKWYKSDFGEEGVLGFIRRYWEAGAGQPDELPDAVTYQEYEWLLNSIELAREYGFSA